MADFPDAQAQARAEAYLHIDWSKMAMRDAQIWVVVVRDMADRHDEGSAYVFNEGQTEAEVLKELWQEWVLDPELEPDEDTKAMVPSWDSLHEVTGDYCFSAALRTIKVGA